jgi:hypothetical protein
VSFYDDASLVLIPSGIKTSKIYSQKPTDGTGDLTFTRSNDTATRVASNGLIEKVRTQQYFKSTALTTSSIFATYNVSPTSLGTYPVYSDSLAYSFAITGVNQGFIFAVASDSNIRAVSVFLKDFGTLDVYWTGSAPLSYGATSEVVNGYTRHIVVIPSGANNLYFRPNGNTGTTTTVYATAPQIEYGDIATAYISNDTTASAVSVGPLANVPRLDYLGSSCPRLLLEPQRTNLFNFSQYFGGWAANPLGISSIEPNYAISPEGVENAYKVNFVVQGDSDLALVEGHLVTGGSTYAYSIYIKGEGSDIGKDIVVKSKRSGGDSAGTITTQTLTDEWVRVDFTTTYAANNAAANFYISSNDATSCLIYGAQAELGSYATSLIPSYGAAVTRGAEAGFKTAISTLLGKLKVLFLGR